LWYYAIAVRNYDFNGFSQCISIVMVDEEIFFSYLQVRVDRRRIPTLKMKKGTSRSKITF